MRITPGLETELTQNLTERAERVGRKFTPAEVRRLTLISRSQQLMTGLIGLEDARYWQALADGFDAVSDGPRIFPPTRSGSIS
jgi:hypothetical protein